MSSDPETALNAMYNVVSHGTSLLSVLKKFIKEAASVNDVKKALAEGFRYTDKENKFYDVRKWFVDYLKSEDCEGDSVVGMFNILLEAGLPRREDHGSSYARTVIIDFVKNADPSDLRNRVCPALEAQNALCGELMKLGKANMQPLIDA